MRKITPFVFIILPFLNNINFWFFKQKLFHSKTITWVTAGYNLHNFKPL